MKSFKFNHAILTVAALALVGVVGSLYFSTFGDPVANIAQGNFFPKDSGLLPCLLCWFARILFYPILPIALIGYIHSDKRVFDYILSLAIPGVLLTIYHYSIQMFGDFSLAGCSVESPCTAMQISYAGFITIPLLAVGGFMAIVIVSLYGRKKYPSKK